MTPLSKCRLPVRSDLQAAGAWVFTGGLHDPSTASVVRAQDGELLVTDGPFTEAKEHLGGSCFAPLAAHF